VPKPKLLDQVREAIRTRHYSFRTEEAYVGWIRRFILFHHKRHPAEMGKAEIEQFLAATAACRPRRRTRRWRRFSSSTRRCWSVIGSDIRTVQELLGHADVRTTMISTRMSSTAAGRVC